ncbi:MAG: FkbM family methyltransferase, partial [Candidatus Limnocylindria bacterium]
MLDKLRTLRRRNLVPLGPKGLVVRVGHNLGVGRVNITPRPIGSQVTLRMGTSDLLNLNQVFGTDEYDFPYPEHARTIVDAGAYVGFSAIYFAKRYPEALIYALEPDPRNHALLRRNTRTFGQIVPIHAALWNGSKQLRVIDAGLREWGLRTVDTASEDGRGIVQSVSMEALLDMYEIEHVDILKVDIEGAEREVFADASRWID